MRMPGRTRPSLIALAALLAAATCTASAKKKPLPLRPVGPSWVDRLPGKTAMPDDAVSVDEAVPEYVCRVRHDDGQLLPGWYDGGRCYTVAPGGRTIVADGTLQLLVAGRKQLTWRPRNPDRPTVPPDSLSAGTAAGRRHYLCRARPIATAKQPQQPTPRIGRVDTGTRCVFVTAQQTISVSSDFDYLAPLRLTRTRTQGLPSGEDGRPLRRPVQMRR